MGCESNQQRMLHLIRGDLPEEERKILQDHLSRCAACREDLDAFRYVFEVTKEEEGASGGIIHCNYLVRVDFTLVLWIRRVPKSFYILRLCHNSISTDF